MYKKFWQFWSALRRVTVRQNGSFIKPRFVLPFHGSVLPASRRVERQILLSTLELQSVALPDFNTNLAPCELSDILWTKPAQSNDNDQDYIRWYMSSLQSRLWSSVELARLPGINSLLLSRTQPSVRLSATEKSETPDWQNALDRLRNDVPIQIDSEEHFKRATDALRTFASLLLSTDPVEVTRKAELSSFLERLAWSFGTSTFDCRPLVEITNKCLAVLGKVNPIYASGLRILSIDGGGLRGFSAITVLKAIEDMCEMPIKKCFDLVCGTSTGAVLAALLIAFNYDLAKVDSIYRKFGPLLFDQNIAAGIGKLIKSQAYYDTASWESILRQEAGEVTMLDSARDRLCPRVAIVACATGGCRFHPFVFRNYGLTSAKPHLQGTFNELVWKAIRASTSVPVFYESFNIESKYFADGGLVANNPVWIAVSESKQLWPDEPISCVVSIGNGLFSPKTRTPISTSLRESLGKVIELATGTQTAHLIMQDSLPEGMYFRLNAPMSEEFTLNETRSEKWKIIERDTYAYLERNRQKLAKLCRLLLSKKNAVQRASNSMQRFSNTFL